MSTPTEIRYRGQPYPVIDSMRLGGRTYLILAGLSGGFPERFQAFTRDGAPGGMMWTIHLLQRSKPTLARLKALLRVSEFNTNVPTIIG